MGFKSRGFTHFDAAGKARMVDVTPKPETARVAVASGRVRMHPATARAIQEGTAAKGDVLGAARIAAIQAIKRTPEAIPLCHAIRVTGVDVEFRVRTRATAWVTIRATVRAFDRTGAEMEALHAVGVAALTIYDMCKAVDRRMTISDIQLEEKTGGASGTWTR